MLLLHPFINVFKHSSHILYRKRAPDRRQWSHHSNRSNIIRPSACVLWKGKALWMYLLCWPILVALAAHTFGNDVNSTNGDNVAKTPTSVGTKTASQSPDDVRFYLFSNPSNASQAEQIVINSTKSLLSTSFNCAKVTKILVHGFTENGLVKTGFPANVKKEYLKKFLSTGYNIISVDWGPLATCTNPSSYLCYPKAALENVEIAGRRIGEFIVWLRGVCGREYLDLVHVVGHSLGSHVSGYAGHTVLKLTGGHRIRRLTGLDPAGPLFVKSAPTAAPRIMKASDANFTDVYHTAAGVKGTACAVGHLDLFVNGGFTPQPDCGYFADLKSFATCSHAKSHEYYADSIAFGDPTKNTSARVPACRLFPVHCLAVAPDLSSLDGCDQMIVYGEYLKPGTAVGTYCVGYPPPRKCLGAPST